MFSPVLPPPPMDDQTYEAAVRREAAQAAGTEPDQMTLDARFEDVGIDSLDALGIIANLEDEFGVEVPDEDLKGLETVGDAVAVLRRAAGVS